MKTIITILGVCILSQVAWPAETFDTAPPRTQRYIVESLADAITSCEVAVLLGRSDEWLRSDDVLNIDHRHGFDLRSFRHVASLKSAVFLPHYGPCYVYPPKSYITPRIRVRHPKSEKDLSPPYRPRFPGGENLTVLMFLRHVTKPLEDRILPASKQREGISGEVSRLGVEAYMEKHELREVFSSRVFLALEGCMFRVDHPVPELPETKAMRLNHANQVLTEARVPELQRTSGLITLSSREVSEVVFTAYWLEGADEGAAKYAAACAANPAILLPLAAPADFETEIGKRLFEAVKAKPPVQEKPPAKASP